MPLTREMSTRYDERTEQVVLSGDLFYDGYAAVSCINMQKTSSEYVNDVCRRKLGLCFDEDVMVQTSMHSRGPSAHTCFRSCTTKATVHAEYVCNCERWEAAVTNMVQKMRRDLLLKGMYMDLIFATLSKPLQRHGFKVFVYRKVSIGQDEEPSSFLGQMISTHQQCLRCPSA